MSHWSDDELVLKYYGEGGGDGAHLQECAACADRYAELSALLATVRIDAPERSAEYGEEVWRRIAPALTSAPGTFTTRRIVQWSLAAAATIALVATGFLAGRWSTPRQAAPQQTVAADHGDAAARRRVLLLSVADHLERSDRVLTEIMNSSAPADLAAQREWASDLVEANRLYRQDAADANEPSIAAVLDELERALLDIVHRPDHASAADLDALRRRIDSAALLFKVRVLSDDLRQRRAAAPIG